jgi:hypothetical protein
MKGIILSKYVSGVKIIQLEEGVVCDVALCKPCEKRRYIGKCRLKSFIIQ